MPFLKLSNISLSGKIAVVPKKSGPEFIASETSSTTSLINGFGYTMVSDETSLIIGSYLAAKAFIYDFNGTDWVKTAEFTKTGRFGYKAAISGEWAAVTNTVTGGNGSVFLYRKVNGTWGATEHTTLTIPPDVTGTVGYASSVALSGNTLVVGHTKAGNVGGAHVYVFNGTAWVKQGGLLTIAAGLARAGSNQNFGTDVAVDGDTLIVGGPGDTLGKGAGMAFISKRTGSTWSAPIGFKPDTSYADGFGWSVALRGDTAVVGAPFGNAGDKIPGRAFVYDVSTATPTFERALTAKTDKSELIQDPMVATADNLGWSVSIHSNEKLVIAGATMRDNAIGAAYVYEKANGQWSASAIPTGFVVPVDKSPKGRFGSAVAFAQTGFVVSSVIAKKFYWFK